MNRILVVCLFALTFVATMVPAGSAQSATASNERPSFAGTWKGTMNDLPGIELVIQEAGKKVSGGIVFYFQERADVNSPWRVRGDYSVPLLKTRAEGKVLTFEVQHHVCHGCLELGRNVAFRMELAKPNEARLARLEDDGAEAGPQVMLIRGNEASGQAAPPLQAGISVEMPVSKNASPMPEADQEDALIVTVTVDGRMYMGTRPIDLDGLSAELQGSLSSQRMRRVIYIKADSRAPYARVMKVVDAVTAAGIERTVLLTSPLYSLHRGAVAPPNGMTLVTGGCLSALSR
ncbi:MAG TPA: biopolymer transporter ExbD [Terriglobales bacterium]